ncbi:PilZ domain-containing protein [Brevundimonas lenta]|uniref:PilZ domain-containing protein n=1 Tax=Brevundimonas lenta TaxID=424796 RepID=A0A7W6NNM4_9CAUL|nr:PilZ domain-containing protein [Brevundimonas lenta]MBB4081302.1 hypothetical protein [Brevundimonas lenta]
MKPPQDRRFETRSAANSRGVVVAPGLEMPCLIVDASDAGLRIRMDRGMALPSRIQIVDVALGLVIDAEVAWSKGNEIGVKRRGQAPLRGLVPSRLAPARDAFLRAGGR